MVQGPFDSRSAESKIRGFKAKKILEFLEPDPSFTEAESLEVGP